MNGAHGARELLKAIEIQFETNLMFIFHYKVYCILV